MFNYVIKDRQQLLVLFSEFESDCLNIEMPTLGGKVFWEDWLEIEGWRIQVNRITGHARILDECDVRKAWGTLKVMEEKLKRLKQDSFILPGDVLGVSRIVYEHYAVYIGDNKVIHYDANDGILGNDVTVHIAPMSEFLKGSKNFFVLNFDKNHRKPRKIYSSNLETTTSVDMGVFGISEDFHYYKNKEKYHLYSAIETVQRAKKRIGENEYNLLLNNCEHFAIWCKTGISESYQIKNIIENITTHIDLTVS